MIHEKRWTVEIFVDEHDDERRTTAEARLHTADSTTLRATGVARRHPADREVPEIGDELAVARALFDLAHQLMTAAALDLADGGGKPARVGIQAPPR